MGAKVSSLTMFRGQVRPITREAFEEFREAEDSMIAPDLAVRRSLEELLAPARAAMMLVAGLLVVATSRGCLCCNLGRMRRTMKP